VNKKDIFKSFKRAGISPSDTVMIHGDTGIAAQFNLSTNIKKIQYMISSVKSYFNNKGTVIVPTFSYSFTKKESYNRFSTPSDIGDFSNYFWKTEGVKRSNNPIFSVASIGKYSSEFSKSRVDDCFGKDTAFDLLHRLNGKIICLGCEFNRITFVHYVEQKYNVHYRYFKNFSGDIYINNKPLHLKTSYYVRNLRMNSDCDLNILKNECLKKKKLHSVPIGRFYLLAINARDFYKIAWRLLKEDKSSLIKKKIE
jgi:aminoglycoside 3-N-acetyltransferase